MFAVTEETRARPLERSDQACAARNALRAIFRHHGIEFSHQRGAIKLSDRVTEGWELFWPKDSGGGSCIRDLVPYSEGAVARDGALLRLPSRDREPGRGSQLDREGIRTVASAG